jgi:predicted short-subunit dehydrogenase-like oxidoreductase (DUF2520 family)
MYKISIIGTGNVATVLAKYFAQKGHAIIEVFGRNIDAAKVLANIVGAGFCANLPTIKKDADIYVIAVSDKSIESVVAQLPFLQHKLLLHTAAAVDMQVLASKSSNCGVLYPLQSLRKEINYIPSIPFFIEASNDATHTLLNNFAHTLTPMVHYGGMQQRLQLHLAAVLVSNFTNHLYALTQQYCLAEQMPFNTLLPLIEETANRIKYGIPIKDLQTGPAVRNDDATIQKHLSALFFHPQLKDLYMHLTNSIKQLHKTN